MKFDEYVDSIRHELVDARFKAFKSPSMLPHADIFDDIVEYNSKSAGKLLRPLLCVLVNDALGGEHAEAVHIGAAIELVHAGSLVHDDIIDNDLFRRGMKTVHEQFSVKAAILFGDILFVASAAATRTLPDKHMALAFKEIMDAYGRASSGAMKENYRNPWDMQEYFDVIKLKTAALFRASARLGCVTADAGEDVTTIISNWAEDIGIAFQLEDDISDIGKSLEQQEPVGDVKEGKVTLPLILLKQKYPALEKKCNVYVNGVENLDEIAEIMTMMPEGIELTEKHIEKMIKDANFRLRLIPFKNGFTDVIKEYGNYIVESMRKES